jgi:hypothetical protein
MLGYLRGASKVPPVSTVPAVRPDNGGVIAVGVFSDSAPALANGSFSDRIGGESSETELRLEGCCRCRIARPGRTLEGEPPLDAMTDPLGT